MLQLTQYFKKGYFCLILILSSLLDSAKTSSTAGSNQTNLTSRGALVRTGGRHTNMLVVSSSVGMLDRVHGHTTHTGPGIALNLVFVVGGTGLEKRLVGTSTSGNDTNLGTHIRGNSLLSTRRKTETGGSFVVVVGHNDSKGTGSTGKGATITNLGLDVADNGTFGYRTEGKNVADRKAGLLSAVNELSRVHTLGTDQELGIALVTVGIEKLDLAYGSSSTGVMDDILNDTTNVAMLFGIINGTELDRTLAKAGVGRKDSSLSLPLNLSDHLVKISINIYRSIRVYNGSMHYPIIEWHRMVIQDYRARKKS